MFAKYTYVPNSAKENVLADIIAILTGTTDKALLSPHCSQENTYINKTAATPAGWETVAGGLTTFTDSALPNTTAWTDVAWNGTVFCAIGGASYSGYAISYCAVSTDGIVWTIQTMPTTAPWSRIIWNGSLFCAIAGYDNAWGTSAVAATSPDGITWTQRTLPAASYWGTLGWGGTTTPLFVAMMRGGTSSNVAATSPDGVTWTSRTLPVTAYWAGIAWSGSLFCAVAGVNSPSNVAITSPDGITWTQRLLPASTYWSDIAHNGTLFCAISGGITASNIAATSTDGITWTQRVLPSSQYWRKIVWNGALFIAIAGGNTQSNVFATSADGITWTQRVLPTAQYYRGLAWGGGKWCALGTYSSSQNNFVTMGAPASANTHIRALNADGTTYKYANIDVSSVNRLSLKVAELFGVDSITNLCYQSDDLNRAQQLDLLNGGILYIAATARYLYLLSYKTTGAVFGSAGYASFCGLSEYSRDDAWNTSHPPYAFISPENFSACYVPRIKKSPGIDAFGSEAVLALQPNYSMTKQILNAAGASPIHSAVDLRLANTASWTYTVLGGLMLGGVKRTTDAFGVMTDETVIGTDNYVVWTGGTGNTAFRFLVPKF